MITPEKKTAENSYEEDVNHPAHYTDGQIEVISYIEDKGFIEGFCKGNAIKYVSRAGKKDSSSLALYDKEIQDLEKAVWYLNYYIHYLKRHKDYRFPKEKEGDE